MTEPRVCDFLVVGAGMAGVSCGYELAAHGSVIIVERESHPGFHTTGRSAALYSATYGNAVIRALSRASRGFFDNLPQGFSPTPILSPRGSVYSAHVDDLAALDRIENGAEGLLRRIDQAEILARVPIMKPEHAAAGLFEADACDIDVHALLSGYLRGLKARGGVLVADAEVKSANSSGGRWRVETSAGAFAAPVLINAAGAWADIVAGLAGVAPLGLAPLRRTVVLADAPPIDGFGRWPHLIDAEERFYFKPDAGRLLMTPADETPSPPCDAQPDELDVAIAIDRVETATTLSIRRVLHRWAGLRTFAPDRSLVIGFDAGADGFFWLAGQGGYGIQTAPATARLAAALASRSPLPDDLAGIDRRALSPRRFRRL